MLPGHEHKMDGWMREFNVTFAKVRPNRQAGTTVMRPTALLARMKLPSNMAAHEHKCYVYTSLVQGII